MSETKSTTISRRTLEEELGELIESQISAKLFANLALSDEEVAASLTEHFLQHPAFEHLKQLVQNPLGDIEAEFQEGNDGDFEVLFRADETPVDDATPGSSPTPPLEHVVDTERPLSPPRVPPLLPLPVPPPPISFASFPPSRPPPPSAASARASRALAGSTRLSVPACAPGSARSSVAGAAAALAGSAASRFGSAATSISSASATSNLRVDGVGVVPTPRIPLSSASGRAVQTGHRVPLVDRMEMPPPLSASLALARQLAPRTRAAVASNERVKTIRKVRPRSSQRRNTPPHPPPPCRVSSSELEGAALGCLAACPKGFLSHQQNGTSKANQG